jgi:hypothetical protein
VNQFYESMQEYKIQMQKGAIQQAYKGLMEYIMGLRTHFQTQYPGYFVSGSIYYGYMDMTYFSVVPETFQQRKLKIALVFIHETCQFEVWLAASNKQVQSEYWKLIKDSGWEKYRLVPSVKGYDSILEQVIVGNPDFRDLDRLTQQIEAATLEFIRDIEDFLS